MPSMVMSERECESVSGTTVPRAAASTPGRTRTRSRTCCQKFRTAVSLAYCADDQREQLRAAVFPVVAIDAGDDRELQAHGRHSLGHAPRLIVIHRQRRALFHRAESAAAGAHIAKP